MAQELEKSYVQHDTHEKAKNAGENK